jgi:HSP20 family protein
MLADFFKYEQNFDIVFKTLNEKDNHIILCAVPGLKKEEIKIEIKNKIIIIAYENVNKSERNFMNSFSKSFILPGTVSIDKINAKLEDGILEIIIPKLEEHVKSRIIYPT